MMGQPVERVGAWEEKHTGLHTHEDTPRVVGCGIDKADQETTDEEGERGIMEVDCLCEISTQIPSGKLILMTEQWSRLHSVAVHGRGNSWTLNVHEDGRGDSI